MIYVSRYSKKNSDRWRSKQFRLLRFCTKYSKLEAGKFTSFEST